MKVVINGCVGGFAVSKKVFDYLGLYWNDTTPGFIDNGTFGHERSNCWHDYRTHPKLVEAVEKLGVAASTEFSALYIVEVPDDVSWTIVEVNGVETIHEVHRAWDAHGEHWVGWIPRDES
jgi:hypothetical protein